LTSRIQAKKREDDTKKEDDPKNENQPQNRGRQKGASFADEVTVLGAMFFFI